MCYCPTPTLYLNLALTGDCAFQLSPKKPHSVWFISVLKSGDMGQCPEKSPSPCNTCVIPVSLYKSMSWFVTKTRTHTHTHTHTHIYSYIQDPSEVLQMKQTVVKRLIEIRIQSYFFVVCSLFYIILNHLKTSLGPWLRTTAIDCDIQVPPSTNTLEST